MTFSIDHVPFGTTLARQIAKQHLDNFNNVFWVGERSFSNTRKSYAHITMPTPGPGVHGYFPDEKAWQVGVDEFRIWSRQHVLISAASLLEVYVQSAATAALSSRPELVDRALLGLSGVKFVKHPDKAPKHLKELIETRVSGMTHGPWTDRFHRMGLTFGALPVELVALSTTLQTLQTRRNRIAHSYGYGGELRKTPWEPLQAIEVTAGQIVSAIKDVSSAIRIMDNEVFGPEIGGYEIIHEFHVWSKKHKSFNKSLVSGMLLGEFRDHIGKAFGNSPGATYFKGMHTYYSSL